MQHTITQIAFIVKHIYNIKTYFPPECVQNGLLSQKSTILFFQQGPKYNFVLIFLESGCYSSFLYRIGNCNIYLFCILEKQEIPCYNEISLKSSEEVADHMRDNFHTSTFCESDNSALSTPWIQERQY